MIEDLGADHEDLLARSGRIRSLVSAARHDDATAAFADLIDALRLHTDVEEASVFAGLRAAGEMLDHVEALAADHAEMWDTVTALDGADPSAWDAAVVRLLDDLHDHITREEYDLFPATLLAIAPGEWDAIETAALAARGHAV